MAHCQAVSQADIVSSTLGRVVHCKLQVLLGIGELFTTDCYYLVAVTRQKLVTLILGTLLRYSATVY